MKKILLCVVSILLAISSNASVIANDGRAQGEKLFKSKGCTMCHKKETASIAPSLVEIGKVYSGKERQLYKFLKAKGKAKINPKKAHVMRGQFIKLRALSDDKIKAIGRYIITISDREMM